jgi:hypothetical protein
MNAPARKLIKTIRIDLAQQLVEAYLGAERVLRFECVSGDKDHPTDRGIFKIMRKNHPYRSRAYDVQMDYAMFFTVRWAPP